MSKRMHATNLNHPLPRERPPPPGAPRLAPSAHPRSSAVPFAVRQQALRSLYAEFLALYGAVGGAAPALAPVAQSLAQEDALAQEAEMFRVTSASRAGYVSTSHTTQVAVSRRAHAPLAAAAAEALVAMGAREGAEADAGAARARARDVLAACTETGTQQAVRAKRAAAARAARGRITASALRNAHYVCPTTLLPRWRYMITIPEEWGPGGTTPTSEGEVKTCDRCSQTFDVVSLDQSGAAGGSNEAAEAYPPCRFHHGRKRPDATVGRQRRVWRWTCCGAVLTPDGSSHESAADVMCCSAPLHVFREEQPEQLHQRIAFMATSAVLPPKDERAAAHDVLSLDCELCYTTAGKSLTQLAIISSEGKTIANVLVQPAASMIDYNTRFSGLSAATFKNAAAEGREVVSFAEARDRLLSLMHRDTILVGHGLENDLSALRIVHPHIVDTAMLFPHPRGPPCRQSLRDLVAQHLGRLIQADQTAGHDAMEDALAPLHLIQAKLAASDSNSSGAHRVPGDAKGVSHISPFDPNNKATRSSPYFSVEAHMAQGHHGASASAAAAGKAAPPQRLNAMALMSSSASKKSRAAVFAPTQRKRP